MASALIKLTYKHVIDASSEAAFEQNVFKASYREFLLKSQAYNTDGKLQTFTQLKAKDGRANSLHYKISFAALHFLDELKNTIPVLTDVLGGSIKYETPAFELLESDLTAPNEHRVAIKFTTATLVLHQVIGNVMILSYHIPNITGEGFLETFTLNMQPGLAITAFCILNTDTDQVNQLNSFNSN